MLNEREVAECIAKLRYKLTMAAGVTDNEWFKGRVMKVIQMLDQAVEPLGIQALIESIQSELDKKLETYLEESRRKDDELHRFIDGDGQ